MGVCEVPDSCCGSPTSGSETCDTIAGRLQWFLLVVRSKQEPKVAEGLQAKLGATLVDGDQWGTDDLGGDELHLGREVLRLLEARPTEQY